MEIRMSTQQPEFSKYGYNKTVDLPFGEAVEKTRAALKDEGFGVLCEIDIKDKLKEKLGIDFRNYVILGSCNPPLAYQSLQQEINVGLLLPCNVIVYEQDDRTGVSAINAQRMLALVGNPKLESIATQVDVKLRRVVDSLPGK